MITYAVEPWSSVQAEMAPLWVKHYEEVALNRDKMPLDPDFANYDAMEQLGMLHIVVARKEGQIVGYHFTLVRPHLHYVSTLCGMTDIYWIAPENRTGRTPLRLFQFVESTLKARGVKKLFTGTKKSLDAGPLFEFMGWHPAETLYTKYIGD
jgi:hypothetical protein